jgi:salicylate hydroxylase
MSIKVLVAGGGIGGLAAALACARAGHAIELFERAPAFAEIGAGIQLGPNVTRILHGWGLQKPLEAVAAYPDRLQARDAVSGKNLGTLRLGDTAQARYGAPYATVHRADLHALLAQAVMAESRVTVQLDSAIDRYQQTDAGIIATTVRGEPHSGNLLVGADGLCSRVRQQLLNDGAPEPSEHRAYRALIAQSSLPAASRSGCVTAWLGPQLHVVQYPVRGGEWLNVVAFIPTNRAATPHPTAAPADEWDQAASTAALKTAMRGVCKPLDDLIHAIDIWRAWPVCHRPPMQGPQEQARGLVALLGDAAHPMLPYLAQGAGMAIEDAAELARCLTRRPDGDLATVLPSDIAARLQRYARARWQRNARVQARALRNGQIFHATGLVRWGRDLTMLLLGERVLDLPWLYAPNQFAEKIRR